MKNLILAQIYQSSSSNEQEINRKYRQIRQKKSLLNSQQKKIFEYLIKNNLQIDLKKSKQSRIILNGIPETYKQIVWGQLIKNNHGITERLFESLTQRRDKIGNQIFLLKNQNQLKYDQPEIYLQKAKSEGYMPSQELDIKLQKVSKWFQNISLDIPRTFSQLKIFQDLPQQISQLRYLSRQNYISNESQINSESRMLYNILSLFVMFREDIGYRQGMSQIAGYLLIQVSNQLKSFQLFCSIITTDVLYEFFTMNLEYISSFCVKIAYKIRQKSPKVYEFFNQNKLDYKIFVLDWIFCLFTKCFQLDNVGKIWDILFLYILDEKVLILLIVEIILSFSNIIIQNFHSHFDQDIMMIGTFLKKAKIDQIQSERILQNLRQLNF